MRPLLPVLAVLLLPACGGEEAQEAAAPNGAGDGALEVVLADFALEPAALSAEAGEVTLHVVNEGATAHGLTLEGPGVEASTEELAPGESADLVVDLPDGAYTLWCPVGGHRAQGMEGTLTVGEGAAPAPETTTAAEEPGYRY
jgi:uncharacterized cupredoxin-like copper-binding protein